VAVDHLVVLVFFAADHDFAQWRAEFAARFAGAAFVADLFAFGGQVGPAAVRLGVGDRLVVLVAEPALDDAVKRGNDLLRQFQKNTQQ